MRLDPSKDIFGIRPSVLRKLMRWDRFSTLDLMGAALLNEPLASSTLHGLADAGWVEWIERDDGIDQWKPTEIGNRLSATRLIKRFPIEEGRAIVEKAVAKARELNADANRSSRITALHLFGSVLNGSEDGTCGDVDLIVETARRKLPSEQYEALRETELAAYPNVSFVDRLWLPSTLLKRALKSVSRKIALHGEGDLRLPGLRYKEIYSFDIETEAERLPRGDLKTAARHQDAEDDASSEPLPLLPTRLARPWPPEPARPAVVSIRSDEARLAQHLWQNDVAPEVIAKRTYTTKQVVVSYLSSRPRKSEPAPFVFYRSLEATLLGVLPGGAGLGVECEVRIGERSAVVFVDVYERRRIGRLVWSGAKDYSIMDAKPHSIELLERVGEAAARWREKMRSRSGGLVVISHAAFGPGVVPEAGGGTTPADFRSLEQPMIETLRAAGGEAGDHDWRLILKLTSGQEPMLMLQRSYREPPAILSEALSEPVLRVVSEADRKQGGALLSNGSHDISVSRYRHLWKDDD